MSETLQSIAKQIVADYKGLLAADESMPSAEKRLASVGLESTEENRRQYRNLFLTTDGLGDYISGIILFDETVRQNADDGTPFVKLLQANGVIPGIKVDKGAVAMDSSPDEKITTGLDGLAERFAEYYQLGCRFTKWRAIITIGKDIPTDECITENAKALAQYASLAQAAGIVPVVEPEVLYDKGDHDIARAEEVNTKTLHITFEELKKAKVDLTGMILKPSMVLASKEFQPQSTPKEIGTATIRCFQNEVPPEVPGIVFLSGGQSSQQAAINLNAVQQATKGPWTISFSYGRALQGDALKIWQGKSENVSAAQTEFTKGLKAVHAANQGKL